MIHLLGAVTVVRHAIRHNATEHRAGGGLLSYLPFCSKPANLVSAVPLRFGIKRVRSQCKQGEPSPALQPRPLRRWAAESHSGVPSQRPGLVAGHAENMPQHRRGSSSFIDITNECLTFQTFTAEQHDGTSAR